ncbi:sulfotransferase family 2 domain-containing protein [Nocardioides sp.]|uniref:sulfotransferase family 2 domain-containing protein n=1 Tax=Nocardioides sp. TaxID=35761 RepID=UPI003564BFE5
MIVSASKRVLFVHVQKTGGMTVDKVLRGAIPDAERVSGLPGAKHARLRSALRDHPEFADYWTFGFVRNPWARLWSWYSMIERRGQTAEQGNTWVDQRIARNSFWSGVLAEVSDFEGFVMHGTEKFPRLRIPQSTYLRTKAKQADFVGRTESFDADLATVCNHIGIPAPETVPRRNAGPGGDWRAQYTPAMRQKVAELYAADLREYGYEFA